MCGGQVKRCKIIKKAQAKAQATAMPIRVPTEDGIQELLKLVDLLPRPETNAGKMNVLPTKQFLPTTWLLCVLQTLSGAARSSGSCFPWRTSSLPPRRRRPCPSPALLRSRSFCCRQHPRRLRKPSSRYL